MCNHQETVTVKQTIKPPLLRRIRFNLESLTLNCPEHETETFEEETDAVQKSRVISCHISLWLTDADFKVYNLCAE